jgi:hypothetical protein
MFDDFVHHENIRRCEGLLRTETDPAKRTLIQTLLDEELAKDGPHAGEAPLPRGERGEPGAAARPHTPKG